MNDSTDTHEWQTRFEATLAEGYSLLNGIDSVVSEHFAMRHDIRAAVSAAAFLGYQQGMEAMQKTVSKTLTEQIQHNE